MVAGTPEPGSSEDTPREDHCCWIQRQTLMHHCVCVCVCVCVDLYWLVIDSSLHRCANAILYLHI